MNVTAMRLHLLGALALLLTLAGIAATADLRAVFQPANERKAAPQFALKDSSGKKIELKDYHGKVVLLDFWATWCTGCKMEIPWFSEFQRTYGAQGFAVVGVSMDEGGWRVLKPFLAETHVPYPILLGDGPTAQRFAIQSLPDTLLIDRQGRVAAAYLTVLVDKDDVEVNIKALPSQR
jgi:peroxiredoxin